MWIEMSRDAEHGAGDWGFSKCLWSPSRKTNGAKWAYWETVLQTRERDIVLHLRGEGANAAFVGISYVAGDGRETSERPPEPGQWKHSTTYYRALLEGFTELDSPIFLRNVFKEQESALVDYFNTNKNINNEGKLRLFYVPQAGRLQCLNGAYLSQMDLKLARILLSSADNLPLTSSFSDVPLSTTTGERDTVLLARIGQQAFSRLVRNNYDCRCCFPECDIHEDRFLVGAHIARWSDVEVLRGEVSNGLCFCLMHDKAFEAGFFTITRNHRIYANPQKSKFSEWAQKNIHPYHGAQIRLGRIAPALHSLEHHWERIGLVAELTKDS